jgi:phosphoenolpyruvate carboxykinase (ATP)
MLFQPEVGVTLVIGMDCVEAVRMSFLAQAMYRAKRFGGLGLHAGSKLLTQLPQFPAFPDKIRAQILK